MNNVIKVGVIGCGTITRKRHAPEYAKNRNCELYAFSDACAERAKEIASEYGCKSYETYKQLLADESIDAVSVCTSNNTHAQISIEAMAAGKHVLCEKPMALSTYEAEQMIEASKKYGRVLMPAHNQRLFMSHTLAKKIIDSNELGKIISFDSRFKHGGPENWSVTKGKNTWFMQKSSARFGVLGDLGIHKLDAISFLLGDVIEEVYAELMTLDKKNDKGDMIDVEDNAVVLCHTAKGVSGIVSASWTNYGKEENSTILYCENGKMLINVNEKCDVELQMSDGKIKEYDLGGISSNKLQKSSGVIDLFIDNILNRKNSVVCAEDGFNSIAVLQACIESNDRKCFVRVEQNKN